MSGERTTTAQALDLHKQFLQLVLQDVMQVLASGEPSPQRLVRALEAYWASCLRHRHRRVAVQAAVAGTSFEDAVEPLGRPFRLMLQAELAPMKGADTEQLAQWIYDEARAIAVDEATTGEPEPARRYAVISRILK